MFKSCALIIKFFLMVFTAGCAVGTVRVNSNPEKADVFLSYENDQPSKIGSTPLNMDSRLIDDNKGRYVNIQIKKEGFQTESLYVPTSLMKSSIDISSKLEEFKLPLQCQDQTQAVERIARGIAQVQSLMNQNSLQEALAKLALLLDEYPNISVLQDLLGNAHYMSKNLEMALGAYEKSLKIDPSNLDTQRMVSKLRSILGVRAPANSEASGGQ